MTAVMSLSMRAPVNARVTAGPVSRAASRKVAVRQNVRFAAARRSLVVRAEGEAAETKTVDADEAAFEERLSSLRGKRSKRSKADVEEKAAAKEAVAASAAPTYTPSNKTRGVRDFTRVGDITEDNMNWGEEEIIFEGPPARGEILVNMALVWTLVWIPLAITSVGRGLWSSYKITSKRASVISTSPIRTERLDVPLEEIVDVIAIGRGVGLWGDMVVTLKNTEKVEFRSIPEYKKIEEHIRKNMYKQPEF